jgi:hypothetical protein
MALMNFAFRLESYSYSSEPGAEDEDSTRHEAELLMSLCASSPVETAKNDDTELLESVVPCSSSSSSEASLPSEDSSSQVSLRRDTSFSFICPSLSLETSSSSLTTTGADESPCNSPQRSVSSIPSLNSADEDSDGLTMTPSVLFGRPLTVDDRDALRLSADAMARNVLHSFQKAIDWRIRTWVKSLSSTLVRKEKAMLGQGASQEQLKETLLDTPEAQLLATLHGITNNQMIQVSGAGTSFQVLPQRVEQEKKDAAAEQPALKKQRTQDNHGESTPHNKAKLEEEGDYQYTVAHSLVFECVVDLLTPAGYSEVTLEVPGTIEGTFTSATRGHEEMDNMTSVVVDLDTCMLAAMVEKACRQIVHASAASAMLPPPEDEPSPSTEDLTEEIDDTMRKQETSTSSPPRTKTTEVGLLGLFSTPPPRQVSADITAETVRAALITPREQIISTSAATPPRDTDYSLSSRRNILRPIPDDLEERERGPHRISPQPNSPELLSSSSNGGGGSSSEGTANVSAFPFTLQTPKVKDLWASATSALVSPPLKEPVYHDVPDNGPSLPMLVEVACRAFRGNNT